MTINKSFWKAVASSWISIETAEDRAATFSFAKMLGGMIGTGEKKVKTLAEELFGEGQEND